MSKETLEDQEARLDRESEERIRANMKRVLKTLERQVAGYADPSKASAQTIYQLMTQRTRVDSGNLELSPEQNLQVLDNLENWYTSQGVKYPHPERITQQRNFWQSRVRK